MFYNEHSFIFSKGFCLLLSSLTLIQNYIVLKLNFQWNRNKVAQKKLELVMEENWGKLVLTQNDE